MSYSFDQPYIVIAAVVERDGKYLLIQENHMPDKGKWNLPAGKLDLGEDPAQAASREVLEETGLTFEVTHIVSVRSTVRSDVPGSDGLTQSLRIVFGGRTMGEVNLGAGDGTDDLPEIANFQWLTAVEVSDFPTIDLRYHDLKDLVRDAAAGVTYPLSLLTHYTQG